MRRQAPKGDFRSNLHRGGTAKAVTPTAAECDTALRAARMLGLGVAGVDLIRSKRGPLILEVNASPGLEGIEQASGVDVAGAIIEYVARNGRQGKASKPPKVVRTTSARRALAS
jgi:ribosomal protein S6--L-glutamate ligase